MERESFIFYRSFYEAVADLDKESRCTIYDMICRFALYGEEPDVKGTEKIIFRLIKPQLEANIKRADGAKRGGRPRKETDETPSETIGFENKKPSETIGFENEKPNYNYNENYNKNSNENVNENPNQELEGKIAAADAATQTDRVSDSVLSDSIEKPASPEEKEKSSAKKGKEPSIEEREARFCARVNEYSDLYKEEILNAFCRYWTERNEGGKKMRFEMEKVFDLNRRLITWAKHDEEFAARRTPANRPTTAQSPAASNSVDDIWNNR
ncbi:MAG: hypothetical protein J6U04_06410 [Salinivirgaceae bacterium]|nr:hypothetical protein [Salinivirgaceae bacterium]